MRPISHVIATSAGIPIYLYSHSIKLALCFGIAEIMIDLDHVIDFFFFSKRPLNFMTFFDEGNVTQQSYIIVFLHSYEVVYPLIFLAYLFNNSLLLAIGGGFAFHLMLDEIGNRLIPRSLRLNVLFYFFTYRLLCGFKRERMSKCRNIR